jgi:hypothetical protein
MIHAPNILLSNDEADWATDAYRLADRMPRHAAALDGVKELRHAYGEVDQRKALLNGSLHVASVPWYVMTGLAGRYGYDLMADNGKLFYKWLNKHPEYKVAS